MNKDVHTAHRIQLDITINMMGSSENPRDNALAKYLLPYIKAFDFSYIPQESRGNTSSTQAVDDIGLFLNQQKSPIDPSNRILTSGLPVPEDRSHTKLKDDGQQIDYVVLSPEEISKGFVRPVRRKYWHAGINPELKRFNNGAWDLLKPGEGGCGILTCLSLSIAETFAALPNFYSKTFCCGCNKHLPLEEFLWKGTNHVVGS